MKNQTIINKLNARFNKGKNSITLFEVDKTIKISCEHADEINGSQVGDYYDAAYYDPEEERYTSGINKVLYDWCNKNGLGLEWQNPGCLCVYNQ